MPEEPKKYVMENRIWNPVEGQWEYRSQQGQIDYDDSEAEKIRKRAEEIAEFLTKEIRFGGDEDTAMRKALFKDLHSPARSSSFKEFVHEQKGHLSDDMHLRHRPFTPAQREKKSSKFPFKVMMVILFMIFFGNTLIRILFFFL